MNVTLSIDDETLTKAQEIATRRGISLDEMVGDYLEELTSELAPEQVIQELEKLWALNSGDSHGIRWTREEIHERSGFR